MEVPKFMRVEKEGSLILVVQDVEETRDGTEKLLKADGFGVDPARHEQDAITRAARQSPDLILVSLGGATADVIVTARRIRDRAALGDNVPIVIFCVESVVEGGEVNMGDSVYLAHPDNFNQLRALLHRLLQSAVSAPHRRGSRRSDSVLTTR